MGDNNRCRLCLKTSEENVSIFSSDIPTVIEELTSIKLIENDGLPSISCESCISDLRTASNIRKRIIQSDKILRNELSSTPVETVVKKERSIDIGDEEEDSISDMLNDKDYDFADSDREYDDEEDGLSDIEDEAIEALFRNAREELEQDGIEVKKRKAKRPTKTDGRDYDLSDEEPLIKKIKVEKDSVHERNKSKRLQTVSKKTSPKKKEDSSQVEHIIIKTEAPIDEYGDDDHVPDDDFDRNDDDNDDDFGLADASTMNSGRPGVSIKLLDTATAEKDKDYEIVTLAEDILEKTDDPPGIRCKICDITLQKERAYLHKNKHMKAKCKICGIIIRSDNVKKHILGHKYGPQVCDICGSFHKSIEGLRSHLFNFHTKRKNYKCDQCDQEFRMNSKLWDHKRRVHTGTRPYICDECGKGFYQSDTLKKHKQLVHQQLRAFPCDFCQKRFSSPYARKTHRRKHTGELPYVCDICSEGYRQAVSLRTHLKSKHNIIAPKNKPGYTNLYVERLKAETEVKACT